MLEKMQDKFSKYEVARILGARALQLSMDAPVLLKISPEKLEELNYDVIKIAEMELESEVLPITVKRPLPLKKEEKLKRVKEEKKEDKKETDENKEEISDSHILKKEELEEKRIKEEGEIMELARPDDEVESIEKPKEEEV